MAKTPSALTVAITASVLLVVVVAVDLSMDRTYELQVETPNGWSTIATNDHPYRFAPDRFGPLVQVNETDTVRFRLLATNDRPWALSESFAAAIHGVEAHRGLIEAPAFGDGLEPFEVEADLLLESPGQPKEGTGTFYVPVEVRIDDTFLHGSISVKEVSA